MVMRRAPGLTALLLGGAEADVDTFHLRRSVLKETPFVSRSLAARSRCHSDIGSCQFRNCQSYRSICQAACIRLH